MMRMRRNVQRLKRPTHRGAERNVDDASCPFCLFEGKRSADVNEKHALKTGENTLYLEISCHSVEFFKPCLKHQVSTASQAREVSSLLKAATPACQNLTAQKLICCQTVGSAIPPLTAWHSPRALEHLHSPAARPGPSAAPTPGPDQARFHQMHFLGRSSVGS